MKRLIAILLAGILLLSFLPAFAEVEETEEPISVADLNPYPNRNYDELVVGNPTPMDGKFFTTLWGNSTSDIDVRTLVNSYYLTIWSYDTGIFQANPVSVAGAIIVEDGSDHRTYRFQIADDLYYSDGTKITAWDYAFSVLFEISPIIAELGGQPADLSYLLGYEEYISGEKPYLSGVTVYDDNMTIEFKVKLEYLP